MVKQTWWLRLWLIRWLCWAARSVTVFCVNVSGIRPWHRKKWWKNRWDTDATTPILNSAIGLSELLNAQCLVDWFVDQWSRHCFKCVLCISKVSSPRWTQLLQDEWLRRWLASRANVILLTGLLNPYNARDLSISTGTQWFRWLTRVSKQNRVFLSTTNKTGYWGLPHSP